MRSRIGLTCVFQSTLSMRRATSYTESTGTFNQFQSTLSMRRTTDQGSAAQAASSDFNPRSP